MGPLPMPEPGAFSNPLINADLQRLHEDQARVLALGTRYRTFDRAGKLAFIDAVDDIHDRWLVMLTRLQLCDDFQSQLYVTQLRTRLADVNMTIESMRDQYRKDLNAMRRLAGAQS
jgi:hypothetical protein